MKEGEHFWSHICPRWTFHPEKKGLPFQMFPCSGNVPLELPKKLCSVYFLMGFSGKLFVNDKQPLFPNCPRFCNPWTRTSSTCNFCCCFSFSAERIDCHKIITFELVGSQAWFYDKIPSVCPKGPALLICEMGDWRQAAIAHLQSLTLQLVTN